MDHRLKLHRSPRYLLLLFGLLSSLAASLGAQVEPWKLRLTTDGSEPGADATPHGGPVEVSGRVRAALFVAGHPVAEADTDAPKFRIAGSKAPTG